MNDKEDHKRIDQTPYQVLGDLPRDEFEALKADIAANGVIVPIIFDENGKIIEGHQRFKAWYQLKTERRDIPIYPSEIRSGLTEKEKRSLARKLNALRRHLTSEQKRLLIADELAEVTCTRFYGHFAKQLLGWLQPRTGLVTGSPALSAA